MIRISIRVPTWATYWRRSDVAPTIGNHPAELVIVYGRVNPARSWGVPRVTSTVIKIDNYYGVHVAYVTKHTSGQFWRVFHERPEGLRPVRVWQVDKLILANMWDRCRAKRGMWVKPPRKLE